MSRILFNEIFSSSRLYGVRNYAKSFNPISKTLAVLSNDMPSFLKSKDKSIAYPEHADVVIIGGGFIGSAVAYWLKERTGDGLSVVVLEKDFSYQNSQKNVSLGKLNQHFSLPENIYLSKYSNDFLRNIKEHLGSEVDVQYVPTGSLILASEKYADKLEHNVSILNELGIKTNILKAADIKNRYPWINTEDVKLGCMAIEGEGTFNSWALLKGLIQKSQDLGANYINAEVSGFELEKQRDVLMEGVGPGLFERMNRVIYRCNGEEYAIKFAICVLAAGDSSGEIAKLAKVGTGGGLLNTPLPIEKREYQIYSIENKATETGLHTPMVMDTTGLWLMRNGLDNNLLCGNLPLINDDTRDVSESEYFESLIKPSLLNRIPSCSYSKILKFANEMFDCNTFDNTGILGAHPYHNNLYIAAGFGKLGCQQAVGIGRSVAELIIDSGFTTVDLTRLGFDRLLVNEPLVEFDVY